NDFWAHCAIAQHELLQGKRDALQPHLDILSNPDATGTNPDPGNILFAVQLLRAVGRSPAPLRQFLIGRLLPKYRSDVMVNLKPGMQTVLVNCYAEMFGEGAPAAVPLAANWAMAQRVYALAVSGAIEAKELRTLLQLGEIGGRLAAGLQMLYINKQMDDVERKNLSEELETRIRSVWETVRSIDPKDPGAYFGLAMSHLRQGNGLQAAQIINTGLQNAKDDLKLYQLLGSLLNRQDRSADAYQAILQATQRNSGNPEWWKLTAEAALADRRRDRAIDALRKGREVAPNNPFLVYMEARLLLDAGQAPQALTLLRKLSVDSLATDHDAARAYTRAVQEVEGQAAAEAFVTKTETAASQKNSALPLVGSLRGLFDLPADTARTEWILKQTNLVRQRFPDDKAS
ncbi:MAG: tetratricopeptide repeat protein, partial [Gemmataceae bacterium]